MSSNIPTRRGGRTTRAAAIKDNENANARPSRLTSRAKPLSNATTSTATIGANRATAATAASRAKADPGAQGKRKREALGEVTALVTNNNNTKITGTKALKGKDKDMLKDDVVKSKISTTTTLRQPSRNAVGPTTRRTTRSTTVAQQQEIQEEPADDAMVIDEPPVAVHVRRVSTRNSHSTTSTTIHHTEGYRRTSTRSNVQPVEDEAEADRVFKKRRTSSEAPEVDEEHLQAQVATGNDEALEAYTDEEIEADPDGDQWVDLDAEDAEDPLMVSEYVVDICNYMKEIELTTMPNPTYMENQKDLAWKMRGILNDWLIEVHTQFRLLPETLFLAVNIIDRFLSVRVVSLAKLQLVGITCLFMSSKFEEIMSPSVKSFLNSADSSYTESEILQAERYVLKSLDWNLSFPNPVHFLRRVSKADEYDVNVRTVAKYLLEIPCVEWRLIAAPPSLTAAASIWLARLVLGREQWTANLAHYSSYAESSLLPTANLMLNYILKPVKHQSFYKKYARKRFLKSSVYVRDWALQRWPESTQVVLADELSTLKAESRAARESANAVDDVEQ